MSIYSFAPRTPRDEAALRQDLVHDLHERLTGIRDLKAFPVDFKMLLRERVWDADRVLAGGATIKPVSFHEFIHADYPTGLEASYEVIENLIRGDNEALALWTEVTKRPQGERTDLVDNVNEVPGRPTGNSAAQGLRSLKKAADEGNSAAQEQLAETVANRKSVNAACVDAGLRKSTKIDRDVEQRAARAVAEWIINHAGSDDLDALKSNLFTVKNSKSIAVEIVNLTGPSIQRCG